MEPVQKYIFFSNSKRLVSAEEFKREVLERERRAKRENVGQGAIARILTLSEPQPAPALSTEQQQQVSRLLHNFNNGALDFFGRPL